MMPFAQLAATTRGNQRSEIRDQRSEDKAAKNVADNLFVNPPTAVPAPPLPGPQPEPLPPPSGPVVTASMTAALTATANNVDGKADPGDTINYTVALGNTGDVATGLSFNDLLDSHTAFVAGSIKSSPICFDQSTSTNEDVAKALTLTGEDPDGDSLTFSIVSGPSHGSLNPGVSGAAQTYTPTADYNGPDSFTFRVNDGTTSGTGANGNSNETCTVSITVNAVNDAPTFTVPGNPAAVNEDAGAQSVSSFITGVRPGNSGDTLENGQTVSFVITNNTNPGIFSSGPSLNVVGASYPKTATLTYTSAANQNGTATITYHAHDDGGTSPGVDNSADQTFTITINAVNDPPVVVAPAAYAAQANMKVTSLTGLLGVGGNNVTDVDTGTGSPACNPTPFTVKSGSISATTPAGGIVSNVNLSTGSFDFEPPPGVTGDVTFTYVVSDNGCPGVADSAPVTVHVTVTGPVIWFVNPGAGPDTTHTGTLNNPFQLLASANTAMGANANQRIFVYTGSTTSGVGVTLQASQWLIGQGATNSGGTTNFDTFMGITPPANTIARPAVNGTKPTIQGRVQMNASNTRVQGVAIAPPAGTQGLTGTSGAAMTGMQVGISSTLSDVTVTTTGQSGTNAMGVSLNNAGGVFTFISVNVNQDVSLNKPARGISLTSTTGSLNILGSGTTAGSGGTIQNVSGRGIEVTGTGSPSLTIKNTNLTNTAQTNGDATTTNCGITAASGANTNCSAAIHLNNVNGATLDNVNINGSNQNGINGLNVIDLKILNSTVQNCGNESQENGVYIQNLSGLNNFLQNSTFQNNNVEQFSFVNWVAGTLGNAGNPFNVSNCTFIGKGNTTTPGGDGFYGNVRSTGTAYVSVGGGANAASHFRSNYSYGTEILMNDTASGTFIVNGCDFGTLGTTSTYNNSGVAGGISQGSTLNATFTNNTVYGSAFGTIDNGTPILLTTGTMSSGATLNGTITGNTIGSAGTSASGCNGNCNGIYVLMNGSGAVGSTATFVGTISNNNIHQVGAFGIEYLGGDQNKVSGVLHINSNTIDTPFFASACSGTSACGQGIFVSSETSAGSLSPNNSTMCADIGNTAANTINGAWNSFDIRVQALRTSTFKVAGWNGSPANDPTAFIASKNTGSDAVVVGKSNGSTNPGTFTGDGTACSPLFFATGGVPSLDWRPSQSNFYQDYFFNSIRSADPPIDSSSAFDINRSDDLRPIAAPTNLVSSSLSQTQLDSIVAAAIQRWSDTGLSQQQIATLQGIKFEVTDLAGSYLGEAVGDSRITVDRSAGGNGWFIDASPTSDSSFAHASAATRLYADPTSAPAGHVDLLTAIMHEMGHKLGLDDSYAEQDRDSLMYGYLTVGERRLPAKGQAANASPNQSATAHFLSLVPSVDTPFSTAAESNASLEGKVSKATVDMSNITAAVSGVRDAKSDRGSSARVSKGSDTLSRWERAGVRAYESVSSAPSPPTPLPKVEGSKAESRRSNHASNLKLETRNSKHSAATTAAPMPAGGTFPINGTGSGFTLPPNKTITIKFSVTLNNPPNLSGVPPAAPQVFNHGNLSGTNVSGFDTNTVTTNVDLFDSTTTVTSLPNPSNTSQSVTFTATIGTTGSPSGSGTNRTGTVNFKDGGVTIPGCGTQPVSSNQATCTTSGLSTATHTITADYSGDGNFDPSTGTLSGGQVVSKSGTTATLTSSANPSLVGQNVTFTATVVTSTSVPGPPTGTVIFKDGGSMITCTGGIQTLNGSGVATCQISTLAAGNHTITADYSGDTNFSANNGIAMTGNPQVVNKSTPTVALGSSLNPSLVTQNVTFTGTVTAPGGVSGTPAGSLTFKDGLSTITCSNVGGQTLNGSGVGTCQVATLAAGTHTITADYVGDGSANGSAKFNNATGTLSPDQVVNKSNTTTALSAAPPGTSVPASPVTFTATVTSQTAVTGPPAGKAQFLDGATPITCTGAGESGTSAGETLVSGSAACTTSTLSTAVHSITAQYTGDGSANGSSTFNGSTSSALSYTVGNPCSNSVVVTNTNDSGSGSLRDAITTGVCDGGTITFDTASGHAFDPAAGPYTINLSDVANNELLVNKNMTITGPGASVLTVKRVSGAANNFRVFEIAASKTVTISDMTISNGNVVGTAAAPLSGLPGGSAFGGGVSNAGTLTLLNAIVSNNHAIGGNGGSNTGAPGGAGGDAKGGGIFSSGTVTLTNTTVNGNNSATGGVGGNSDATFANGNGGAGLGGGVYSLGTLTLTLTNSTIAGNAATGGAAGTGGTGGGSAGSGSGGGIYNDGVTAAATATITGSTISGNTATLNGGGIFNIGTGDNATLTLTNSTISGNNANNNGGGIYNASATGTTTLTSVTITNNRADNDTSAAGTGGGINRVSGTVTLKNTIVAGNFVGGSPSTTADDIAGTVDAASSYNLIGTGGSGGLIDVSTDMVHNNQVGVADAKLGALADNGGPTQTHALLDTSPALEKGNAFSLTTDQRGFPRPIDFNNTAPVAPFDDTDIGAFERQIPSPTISKAFGPATIQSGGTSTVTLTLTNPNAFALTGASFTDTLTNISAVGGTVGGTCAGANTNTLGAGATGLLSFSGITIPDSGTSGGICTVTFDVTSSTLGVRPNSTSGVTTTQTPTPGAASNTANLTVLAGPTISKAFGPATIQSGGTSTVTLTLTNPNTSPLTNASFTDTLVNMSVNANGAAGGTCTGANSNSLTAGQTALSFSGITIPANSVTCTVTFVVTSSTPGVNSNATSGVTTAETSPSVGAVSNTANLTVLAAPTIAKGFSPATIQTGGTSTVTLTLTNTNTTTPLTNASFTDTLANMSVNATGPAGGTCVGANSNNLIAGQTALSFSGITIPANSVTCTVTFVVTSSTLGTNPNSTSGVTTTQTTIAGAASNNADLTVVAPPTIAKAFGPDKIQTGGTSTVTLTLTNPNATALTGASFTDTLANMSVNATGVAGGTCAGANGNSLTQNQTALSFSGITIPDSGTNGGICTVTFDITSNTPGTNPNATSGVTTTQTTTAGTASNTANLSVFAPPTVLSITRADANPTNLQTVHFTVTFSKAVTGVNIGANSDFTLTTTGIAGASITGLSGSGTTYTVTVDTGTGDGTLRLNVVDDDSIMSTDALVLPLGGTGAGNGNFSAGEVYTVSKSDPVVSSITRVEADPTNLASVHFTVTFSKPVTGVNIAPSSDFALTTTGTIAGASITALSGANATYTVTVNTGSGNGTIRLDVIDDDTIVDSGNRPLGGPGTTGASDGSFTAGEVYTVDKTPPTVTINQAIGQTDPVTGPSASTIINFTAIFSEPVTGFTASGVTISGTAGATVANVSGSGTTYNVGIEGMTQSGTVIADIPAGAAHDSAGNNNTAGTFTDHTVTYFKDDFTTFEVNSTADTDDGFCTALGTGPGNQDCTLREAINAANADAGAETITFNSTVFAAPGPYTINLTGVLADLSSDMTISGPGANVLTVKRNTGGNYRIFNITSGNLNVTIDGLTISNGNSGVGSGGGIFNNSTGTVTVSNSAITGNVAGADGGGILNSLAGTLNLTNTTINGNSAAHGGALSILNTATVNITNSTLSGNLTTLDGGGVYNAGGALTITGSTITNNRADNDNNGSGTGGGIFRSSGTVTLRNTIVAANFNDASPSTTADDISGTMDAASSFNLIGNGGSGGLVNGTNNNQVGVPDPGLQTLGDNGGPTKTHSLQCTSPAIDKGFSFTLTTDQRGGSRPFDLSDSVYPNATPGGDGSDIGAYETQTGGGCIPTAVPPNPQPSTNEDVAINSITMTGTYSQNINLTFTVTQSPSHGVLSNFSAPNCVFTTFMTCTETVKYTPAADFNGLDSFKFKVSASALDSEEADVNITVNPVNDPPSFFISANDTVNEDAGPQTVPNFANTISPGPADESGQTVQFFVTNNTNPGLFSAAPALSPSGTLSYTPAADAFGSATITVVLKDNGGGTDTSAPKNFSITVNSVNDAPSFTKGPDQSVNANAGPQTVANWATNISAGPANESGQILTFNVTGNTNPGLFSAGPAISASGTLTYTSTTNVSGVATITITLKDNGGVANGGVDTSAPQTFNISVNCAPTIVTNSNDSGAGSLRGIIASACPGSTITFDMTPGHVTSPITLTSGELVIDKNLTFQGPGANLLTISGNNTSRVFNVNFASPGVVTFSDLTIANGQVAAGSSGGGILNNSTATVNVTKSTLSNNTAGFGGGLLNFSTGVVNVSNSTLNNNTATVSGGGIYNNDTGTINLTNSTLSGNSGSGGGIFNVQSGPVNITNSTISGNTASGPSGSGGGIYNNSASPVINLRNTIVALNTAGSGLGPDLVGPMTSQGHNLVGKSDNSTGFTNGSNGDIVGTIASPVNPLLAPLANNGGPTQTMALLPGSRALNAGDNAAIVSPPFSGPPFTDQRGLGFNRIVNATVDMGAFESRGFTITASSGTPQETQILTDFSMPLVAKVSSAFAEPLAGGVVTFTAPTIDASGTFPGNVISASATINGSGVATAPTFTANGVAGGPYNVVASIGAGLPTANFALRNLKQDQFITLNPIPNKTFGDADFNVSATASSGLPVSFSASGNCTVNGNTVHITGAGSCTITASQGGNDNYNAAPNVSQTFSVAKANQTITFNALANKTFGDADFNVSATASSGLPVSFSATGNCTIAANTVHITGAGSCTITASQGGNANYNAAANVSQSFNIAKANQTITFNALANKTFGDADFNVSATASSGLPVSFTATGNCTIAGNAVHITGAGSCTITASQGGNANYNAATDVPQSFNIAKANQTITFNALANKTFGNADFNVSATASSGLPVSFTATGNCTIGGNTVHITGAGSCTITASQAGDANYNAAANVPQTFTIAKANTATSLLSSVNPSNFGQNVTFTAIVTSSAGTPAGTAQFKDNGTNLGAPVALNAGGVATFTTSSLTAGMHTITAEYSGDTNFLNSTGTLSGDQVVNALPGLSINDVSVTEGDSGTKTMTFTATLSAASNLTITVNFATANGTATAPSDYLATSGTLTFNPGDLTKTVNVTINGDLLFEPDETFTVNLTSPVNTTISRGTGTCTILNDDAQGGIISFSQANYSVNESGGSITITVNRSGDTTGPATVDYTTPDDSAALTVLPCSTPGGVALPRCDFTTALGTLRFAPGETTKTFNVLISQDNFVEGPETLPLTLSNLTGGAVFGSFPTATLTINDDVTEPVANPIDDTPNFVRQQYHDFLNREPDAAGLAFWTNNIDNCTPMPACTELQRINTSAAFFLSVEFQQSGYYVYRTYKAGFGDINSPTVPVPIRFRDFIRDTAEVDRGVVVGVGSWQAQLDANKQAFALAFVQRPDFLTRYPDSTSATAFVNALDTNAGSVLTSAERAALIAELAPNPADTALRADVLMKIAENLLLQQHEFNRAFVLMQYLGYLRRNPDAAPDLNFAGFNFWLNKLNQFNGNYVQAEMVKAFIVSTEYRRRFGQ